MNTKSKEAQFIASVLERAGVAPLIVDLSMNLPPEPDDPELLDRMQDGLEAVGRDLVSLLRYQGFGGVQADKDAASNWLSRRALVPVDEISSAAQRISIENLTHRLQVSQTGDQLQRLSETLNEMLSRLENHFGIELPDYEVQGVSDFKTLAERIQSRL